MNEDDRELEELSSRRGEGGMFSDRGSGRLGRESEDPLRREK